MTRTRLHRLALGLRFAMPALGLLACGGGLSGTYTGDGNSFFESLAFRSDGKVDITWMGTTREGTYEVDGERVAISSGGDTQVFTIDSQGCVDGGGLIGRYCKGGSSSDETGGERPATLRGTYRAEGPNGSLSLEFRRNNEVRFTLALAGADPETREGTYELVGERVRVRLADEVEALELVRRGDALEGPAEVFGGPIQFRKK